MADDGENDEKLAQPQPAQILYLNRKRQTGNPTSDSAPVWLISFTDVVALMLTFFVLLYAMSDPEPEKFDRKLGITDSARASYSGPKGEAGNDEGRNINRMQFENAENLDYLQAVLSEALEKHNAMDFSKIERSGADIILTFDNNIQGNEPVFIHFINELTPFLYNLKNSISIVGVIRDRQNNFSTLQIIASHMRERGYSKPIKIATAYNRNSSDSNISIHIQPHTGQRIE
jgi:hypothetical protein